MAQWPQKDILIPANDRTGRSGLYRCLTPEQDEKRKRTLVYKWSGGVCTESISVIWSSDELGALTHIEGGYYGACL